MDKRCGKCKWFIVAPVDMCISPAVIMAGYAGTYQKACPDYEPKEAPNVGGLKVKGV